MKYVQLVGGVIVSAFSVQQDPEVWPDIVEVEDEDPRYLSFVAPPPKLELKDPMGKLKAFLVRNPDVAELLK